MKDFMDKEDTLEFGDELNLSSTYDSIESDKPHQSGDITLYWDGKGWRDAKSMETAKKPTPVDNKPEASSKQLGQSPAKKKIAAIVVAAILGVGASVGVVAAGISNGWFAFGGSSSSSESSSEEITTCVISFESNGGTKYASFTVDKGTMVDLNSYLPTKNGVYFYGWYLDAEFKNAASLTFAAQGDVTLYAKWGTEAEYLLTFETGAGTPIESVYYKANAYLKMPEDPTRENYTFGGWYQDENCTKEFTFYAAQMPKKDMTVYAKWIALNIIHFNTNGGSAVASVSGQAGEPVSVEAPTKDGYVFDGWYTDADCTKPYELAIIPNKVMTLYAGWHEQRKDIPVTLHINYGTDTQTISMTGDEGVLLDMSATETAFTASVTESLASSYLGNAADLDATPIYNLSAWAYDAKGAKRFDGKLPNEASVDLYAVWTRSAAYCEVTFVTDDAEDNYFIKKNTAIDTALYNQYLTATEAEYVPQGCEVTGFYGVGGTSYTSGQLVAMDMKLIPDVKSANLVYESVTLKNGATTKSGYALVGYNADVQDSYKAQDSLLLMVPAYYNNKPVIAIGANAFKDYPITQVTLPNGLLQIGAEAFAGTQVTDVTLPDSVYALKDNAFANSTLTNLTFNSKNITNLGATVFDETPYVANMPKNSDGFVFFDAERTIIYGYIGTATKVTTPSAKTIGGAAFRDCTTLKEVTLHDNVMYVSDYAFENSAVEKVTLGKYFTNMGKGIFKDCKSLTTVNFASAYNITYLGESMFEGCTALTDIDFGFLVNLVEVYTRAFYGCTSLPYANFNDTLKTLGASAFAGCTSLAYAHFGESNLSALTSIGNEAFAGCTSLKRIILRGDLINSSCVAFGTDVFKDAGVAGKMPVLYVKNDSLPDYSNIENAPKTYKEKYQNYFKNKPGYAELVVKEIDSMPPTATATSLTKSVGEAVTENEIRDTLSVSDATECTANVVSVTNTATNEVIALESGKYTFTSAGEYKAIVIVEDECGNMTEVTVWIIIK